MDDIDMHRRQILIIFASKIKRISYMGLFRFFNKRRVYKDYKHSSHVAIYERIAKELNATAQHVYEIAHGKRILCHDDYVILCHLEENKIVG